MPVRSWEAYCALFFRGKSMEKIARSVGCWAALLLLGACGGGGGGEASSPERAVRLANFSPQSLSLNTVATTTPRASFVLRGDLLGDVAQLAGQTVFVLIDDPTQLLIVKQTVISANGLGNEIHLELKSTEGRGGTLEGNLRVNVCLDSACLRPISGSPITVPYRFVIAPGVEFLDGTSLTVELPFGSPNLARALNLRLPSDLERSSPSNQLAPAWPYDVLRPQEITDAELQLGSEPLTAGSTVTRDLVLPIRPIGTYRGRLKLTTKSSLPATPPLFAESFLDVNYVVTPSDRTIWFSPARLSVNLSSPNQLGVLNVVGATGRVYPTVSRVVYSPGSELFAWLGLVPVEPAGRYVTRVSRCNDGATLCLSSGRRYSAQLFVADDRGVESPVPWDVEVTVP